MRTLYHFPLCPFSRKVRIALREKELPFELVTENFWEHRPSFANLNPAMEVPVFSDAEGQVLAGNAAIYEYLDETYPEKTLLGDDGAHKAEVRRLIAWFDEKFYREVSQYLYTEKVIRYYARKGDPDSSAIRAGKKNVHYHLEYITYLLGKRRWLAGDQFTLADATAAAHLSTLDYLHDVPWKEHPSAKEWYAVVKSRPSFRPLLNDRVPGFHPPLHYANPDF